MYEGNTWPSVHGTLFGSDGLQASPKLQIALVLDFATIRSPVDQRVPSKNDENDRNGSFASSPHAHDVSSSPEADQAIVAGRLRGHKAATFEASRLKGLSSDIAH